MRWVSTVSSVLILAALLLASLTAGAERQAEGQEVKALHFTGIVLAVDTSHNAITVERAGEDALKQRFTVSDRTELTQDGERIALDAVRVGDPVDVVYEMTSGGNEARSVDIITLPTL